MTPFFWKNKKVLITGHTGFKGAWLTALLSSWGARLSGLALPAENASVFNLLHLEKEISSNLGDLRDPQFVKQVFQKERPEIVFHMAAQALVRPSYVDPIASYATNVMGTAYLLEAVRESPDVRSVVIVSSDKCYENREWERGYSETDAMGGWDPYSSSKGCTEILTASWVRSFFQNRPVGIASGRAGNVIGGGDFAQERLIPDCMRAFQAQQKVILRNPNATRPWQHVLEPLSGYILLAEKNAQDPVGFRGGWNFGPGPEQELTVEEVVRATCQKWGAGVSYEVQLDQKLHEAKLLKLDCQKAWERLHWKSTLGFPETLQWTVDWYRTAAFEPERLPSLMREQLGRYADLYQSRVVSQKS